VTFAIANEVPYESGLDRFSEIFLIRADPYLWAKSAVARRLIMKPMMASHHSMRGIIHPLSKILGVDMLLLRK